MTLKTWNIKTRLKLAVGWQQFAMSQLVPSKQRSFSGQGNLSWAPGFHKIRYISWLNDGIAGKLFVKLTGMMSCGGRVHLKVNKSWIFLKYMPGVLKTSAQI